MYGNNLLEITWKIITMYGTYSYMLNDSFCAVICGESHQIVSACLSTGRERGND